MTSYATPIGVMPSHFLYTAFSPTLGIALADASTSHPKRHALQAGCLAASIDSCFAACLPSYSGALPRDRQRLMATCFAVMLCIVASCLPFFLSFCFVFSCLALRRSVLSHEASHCFVMLWLAASIDSSFAASLHSNSGAMPRNRRRLAAPCFAVSCSVC